MGAEDLAESLRSLPTRMADADHNTDRLLEIAYQLNIRAKTIEPRAVAAPAAGS